MNLIRLKPSIQSSPEAFRIKHNLLSLARISTQDLSPIHCQFHLLTTPWSLFFSTSGNLIEMQILGPQNLRQDLAICVFWAFLMLCNIWESLLESRWYSCLPHYCTCLLRLKSSVNPSRKASQSPFPPVGRWFFHWPCDIVLSYLPPFFFFSSQWLSSLKAEPAFFILFYSQKLVQYLVWMFRCSLDVQWIKGVRLGVEEEESVGLQKKPS